MASKNPNNSTLADVITCEQLVLKVVSIAERGWKADTLQGKNAERDIANIDVSREYSSLVTLYRAAHARVLKHVIAFAITLPAEFESRSTL